MTTMENPKTIPQQFRKVPEEIMLQQHLRDNPWAMLVGCILLNITSMRQVNDVMPELFDTYPTPSSMMMADQEELRDIIAPLGLGSRRANTLITFSLDWVNWDGNPEGLMRLYGIGDYAYHSWMIFQEGDLSIEPEDKELKRYLQGHYPDMEKEKDGIGHADDLYGDFNKQHDDDLSDPPEEKRDPEEEVEEIKEEVEDEEDNS